MLEVYLYKFKDFDISDVPTSILDSQINDKRKIHYFSWAKLNNILKEKGIDLNNTSIKFNKNGKPYIDELYFNITHSNNYIAFVISNFECGIDIEYVNSSRDIKKLSNYIFKKEINDIDLFYRNWVEKEALVKRYGASLFDDVEKNNVYIDKLFDGDDMYYYAISTDLDLSLIKIIK